MGKFSKQMMAVREMLPDEDVEQLKPSTSPNDRLQLEDIADRVHGDSRPLDEKWLAELYESIKEVGLLQSPVVDCANRLIGGLHRREALRQLKEQEPEIFESHFPGGWIRVNRLTIDSSTLPEEYVLALETIENEKRRGYSKAEIRAIAEKFKEKGYKYTRGRPKKGENGKALIPALSTVFSLNRRTIERYLNDEEDSPKENTTDVAFSRKTVKSMSQRLEQWRSVPPETPAQRKLIESLPRFLKLLEEVEREMES